MCCIFTCCGWMIDLIQRFWTFAMSCCISSAICCLFVTSSMSGIAMGYNYSLAEYIDLKETNVSVYLKRGVFDDEIADDMDWRRSGHMPVDGHLRDSNLMTAGPENQEMPQRSGRRMEDSMVMSDDQHKYEGSLMRLTVKSPNFQSPIEPVTSDVKMAEAISQYPDGSIQQMKAIQSLIHQRKGNNERITKTTPNTNNQNIPDLDGRRIMGIAPGGVPMYNGPYENAINNINSARLAVPDEGIGRPENWFIPKSSIPEAYRRTMNFDGNYENEPTQTIPYPKPIIFTMDMQRPTRPKPGVTRTQAVAIPKDVIRTEKESMKDIPDDEIQLYKAQLLKNKQDVERLKHYRLRTNSGKEFNSEDDYAEQANNGLPGRKKRGLIDKLKKYIKPVITSHKDTNFEKTENRSDMITGKPLTIENNDTENDFVKTAILR